MMVFFVRLLVLVAGLEIPIIYSMLLLEIVPTIRSLPSSNLKVECTQMGLLQPVLLLL